MPSGREPVLEYLQSLPEIDRKAIAADFRILYDFGIMPPSLITRKLKGKLWKINSGTRHQQRIFYCLVRDNGIILLHACKKRKEGAQWGDVELANKRIKGGIVMNKKHLGSSVMNPIKEWEDIDPDFRRRVNEQIEKRKLAAMLKRIREKEHLTQDELARKANVTQSVIARIEGGTSKTLPRFDLFSRIVTSAGYRMSIHATKKGNHIQASFSA